MHRSKISSASRSGGGGPARATARFIIRHRPGAGGGDEPEAITVPMSATAYRFSAGHRLRLQVSGGAHPRFARNTGSGEPPATATRLVAVNLQILHEVTDHCKLSLPVLSGRSDPGPSSATLGRHHTSRSTDVQPRAAAPSRTDP